MSRRRVSVWQSLGGLLSLPVLAAVSALLHPDAVAAEAETADEAVFEMQEVSVFKELAASEDEESQPYWLIGGHFAMCGMEPSGDVKAYPKFTSKWPLYGTLTVDRNYFDPTAGKEFHFAIDESGTERSGEPPSKEEPSLLESLAAALMGSREKPPAEASYDRLYFDANGDLDLTNDPVLTLMKDPPSGVLSPGEEEQVRVFDYVALPIDHGPDVGIRPFRILPKLMGTSFGPLGGARQGYLQFIAPTARKGRIRIGSDEYTAYLTQSDSIAGRFDAPFTGLHLVPVDGPSDQPRAWGYEYLCATRKVDGELYVLSASPTGDKLTVAPYRGDYGTLEIARGGRKIDKLGAIGMMLSDQGKLVTLGELTFPPSPKFEKPRTHKLPVGDYCPTYFTVDFGRVGVALSPNPYSSSADEAAPQAKSPNYGIRIRKDKPCVLDFTGKPQVLFTGPASAQSFKPGETMRLEAVLVDPELDLMIRGLQDTSNQVGEYEYQDEKGNPVKVPQYASLDPTVVITDSKGKQVAEGKMPFG